jgi:phage repressor protein C with HTH and peptisase S24 domain
MKTTWRERLKTIIDETPGLTMKSVSQKAGLSSSTVHSIIANGASPSVDNFIKICAAINVEPTQLLGGERLTISIPVVGFVSAGEGWTSVDDGGQDAVEFDLGTGDCVAVEVRGDSMVPVYRNGDTLICNRQYGPNADNLIGLDCVIRTADGRNYVKILRRGSQPGRFNLRSYNSSVDDIENVALAWVAPVAWIKRSRK